MLFNTGCVGVVPPAWFFVCWDTPIVAIGIGLGLVELLVVGPKRGIPWRLPAV